MKLLLAGVAAIVLTLAPSPAAAVGGPSNMVIVQNRTDGRFAIRANAQTMREPGAIAAPQNFAFANASCTDCQTMAVALQLNFASKEAGYIVPQNVAVASNAACTRCVTIAIAFQVFFTVDDPTVVPDNVSAVMRDLDTELRLVSTDPNITPEEAESRIVAVVGRFAALAATIDEQRSVGE